MECPLYSPLLISRPCWSAILNRRAAMRRKTAFTLVELLVVVGIVGVLIALLLPSINKARRHAAQVTCLSNLRQLGIALIAYANESKGCFPAAASALREQDEDWVHWQPTRDVKNSALWSHLGGNVDVLKCPLGVPERPAGTAPPYPFSYSVNTKFTGLVTTASSRSWNRPPCRLGDVRQPSRKMLAVEEDSSTISDGAWYADVSKWWFGDNMVYISVRHDRDGREYSRRVEDFGADRGRGNVVFADGHGEFTDRRRAMTALNYEPRYDGPPNWPWY